MTTHSRSNYGAVFIGLFVLTVIEISVANLSISKLTIVLSLIALAIVKASLVGLFYMHLKFEKILLAAIALCPLIFSIILTLMVGSDIGHPHLH